MCVRTFLCSLLLYCVRITACACRQCRLERCLLTSALSSVTSFLDPPSYSPIYLQPSRITGLVEMVNVVLLHKTLPPIHVFRFSSTRLCTSCQIQAEHFMHLSSAESVKTDICLTGRMLSKFPYITSVCVTHVKQAQLFASLKDALSNLCIISASSFESGAHE